MKGAYLVIGILFILVLLNCLMLHELGYSKRPETDVPFPESGIWICDELGITMLLGDGSCVIKISEEDIQCAIQREYGSHKVFFHCCEFNNTNFDFGHTFFSGIFLNTYDGLLYIEELKTETVYVFRRIR